MTRTAARKLLEGLYRAAIEAVEPSKLVSSALARPRVDRALREARGVGVFAVGKAAAAMAEGTRGLAGRGLAIMPRGSESPGVPGLAVVRSSHPEPDRASVLATRRALRFFGSFGAGDVILCLVSGGASSMLAMPRRGVTLAAKRRAVSRLAATGASILEINRLRTRLSAVKGGGLGRATQARLVTLVLSDVPGDRPDAVGSGPTIRRRGGDLVVVVGSNARGLEAAAAHARGQGFRTRIERASLSGEARLAGAAFARRAIRLGPGEALLGVRDTGVAV